MIAVVSPQGWDNIKCVRSIVQPTVTDSSWRQRRLVVDWAGTLACRWRQLRRECCCCRRGLLQFVSRCGKRNEILNEMLEGERRKWMGNGAKALVHFISAKAWVHFISAKASLLFLLCLPLRPFILVFAGQLRSSVDFFQFFRSCHFLVLLILEETRVFGMPLLRPVSFMLDTCARTLAACSEALNIAPSKRCVNEVYTVFPWLTFVGN